MQQFSSSLTMYSDKLICTAKLMVFSSCFTKQPTSKNTCRFNNYGSFQVYNLYPNNIYYNNYYNQDWLNLQYYYSL